MLREYDGKTFRETFTRRGFDDFPEATSSVRSICIIYYPPQALLQSAKNIEALARVEGLSAHGQAVKIRREFLEQKGSSADS